MSHGQAGIPHPARIIRESVAAVCLSLIFSSAAYGSIQDIEAANNQLVAQLQRNSIRYTETVNDSAGNESPLDSEDGRFTKYGVSASVMRDVWLGHDYFDGRYSAYSGKTSYTGGTLANPAYGSAVGQSGADIRDYSLRYGTGFVFDRNAMVTLYGEIGRHRYVRTLGLGTPTSYRETYTHNYYGIGALVQHSPVEGVVLSFNAMVGHTHHSNIVAAYPAPYRGFSARLGDSPLGKIGFLVDYALTKHLHANAGVEMVNWSYGASANQPVASTLSLYEPDSRTYVTTAKAGVGFAF